MTLLVIMMVITIILLAVMKLPNEKGEYKRLYQLSKFSEIIIYSIFMQFISFVILKSLGFAFLSYVMTFCLPFIVYILTYSLYSLNMKLVKLKENN